MSQLALTASIWLVSSPTRVISSKSQHHSDRQSSGNDRNLKGGREERESVKNIRGNLKGLKKGERGILLPIPPIFVGTLIPLFGLRNHFLVPLSGSNEGRGGNHASRGNHSTSKDFLLKRG